MRPTRRIDTATTTGSLAHTLTGEGQEWGSGRGMGEKDYTTLSENHKLIGSFPAKNYNEIGPRRLAHANTSR
jgi:hypothetical protein